LVSNNAFGGIIQLGVHQAVEEKTTPSHNAVIAH